MSAPATGVAWDLSALFSSISDPRIEEVHASCHARADRFAEAYRGKVADLGARELLSAVQELESLFQEAAKPSAYASLVFAADASRPEHGAFMQAQGEKATELRVKLMFFELELQAMDADRAGALLADEAMAPYRHYLQSVRVYSPHRLTEAEEVLLEEAANTGSRAWERLHEEIFANHSFVFTDPQNGAREELNESRVLEKLRHPDRRVRAAGAASLTAGTLQLEKTVSFIYNTLLADKKLEDRLRKFDYPEQSRHMANELDREVVDLVTGLCRERSGLVARYYEVKKKILGLSELTHIDRYAPLFEASASSTWEDAQKTVISSFAKFSPEMAARANEFFEGSWIDADPREGKTGGAFCSYNTPDTHPVVMMSYLGTMDNVMTLAHELGHGVHASLSRAQTLLNFHGTLPLAELASIFGEMLVFEAVVRDACLRDKVALYAHKIESIFASVHRQAAMFRFEQRCHVHRREKGELAPEDFRAIWQEELQSMFEDALILGEEHQTWWTYVGHFFFAPFYVYAYSFGELLALSIYQKAKEAGPEFADRYLRVLELGGSEAPLELMAHLDVNLADKAFWEGGFAVIESMVCAFEGYWSELASQDQQG